jgi:hypothetical protein
MIYLGSTFHGNGRFGCEVSRKIGASAATSWNLQTVWKHTAISKFTEQNAVLPRICLASGSGLRRLDGFQATCLRQILGTPCSYISRISNERVCEMSAMVQFSVSVKRMRQKLLGQILTNPKKKQLKDVTFHGDTRDFCFCATHSIGRPRQNWIDQLLGVMRVAAASQDKWESAARPTMVWQDVSSRAA